MSLPYKAGMVIYPQYAGTLVWCGDRAALKSSEDPVPVAGDDAVDPLAQEARDQAQKCSKGRIRARNTTEGSADSIEAAIDLLVRVRASAIRMTPSGSGLEESAGGGEH